MARDFCSNLFSNYKSSEGYKTIFSKDKENVSLRDSNFNTNYTNFLKSPSRGSISDIQSAELKYNLNVKPVSFLLTSDHDKKIPRGSQHVTRVRQVPRNKEDTKASQNKRKQESPYTNQGAETKAKFRYGN